MLLKAKKTFIVGFCVSAMGTFAMASLAADSVFTVAGGSQGGTNANYHINLTDSQVAGRSHVRLEYFRSTHAGPLQYQSCWAQSWGQHAASCTSQVVVPDAGGEQGTTQPFNSLWTSAPGNFMTFHVWLPFTNDGSLPESVLRGYALLP